MEHNCLYTILNCYLVFMHMMTFYKQCIKNVLFIFISLQVDSMTTLLIDLIRGQQETVSVRNILNQERSAQDAPTKGKRKKNRLV